jgi:hypothetical protein
LCLCFWTNAKRRDGVFYESFKWIWILTTLLFGVAGYYRSPGDFGPTLVGVVIGCLLGMVAGFWLPIVAVLAAVAGVV